MAKTPQSLCFKSFFYHGYTMKGHTGLVNRWGSDFRRSSRASSCSTESPQQKLSPTEDCQRNLFGAEDSIKEFAVVRFLSSPASAARGARSIYRNRFVPISRKLGIAKHVDNGTFKSFNNARDFGLTSQCVGNFVSRNGFEGRDLLRELLRKVPNNLKLRTKIYPYYCFLHHKKHLKSTAPGK